MDRKEFLKKTALTVAVINGLSITSVFADNHFSDPIRSKITINELAKISDKLNKQFIELIGWLNDKEIGWSKLLNEELGLDLNKQDDSLINELIAQIDKSKLLKLQSNYYGFDDFAGSNLITPGSPASSLLYHALASPRVKPFGDNPNCYPSIEQLDTLENYIYALKKWEEYNVPSDDKLVLAVFAYEYRPAYKTPHHAHADMVYSRTGIARIGDEPMNYDALNRCYTNKPKDEEVANRIAVSPARYGLFLAKMAGKGDAVVLSTEKYKGNDLLGNPIGNIDLYDDRNDSNTIFLLPIRKVFNHDILFNNSEFVFSEYHVSQKLSSLLNRNIPNSNNSNLDRYSTDLIENNPLQTNKGSSFLVISKLLKFNENDSKASLIRPTDKTTFYVKPDGKRYFTAYSVSYSDQAELLTSTKNNINYRKSNLYSIGRNEPVYVHIGHKWSENKKEILQLERRADDKYENFINKGKYDAVLFEDNICDGYVTVIAESLKSDTLQNVIKKGIYKAFSIVTAPDFFPNVDVFDLVDYDVAPGKSGESNFLEGGIASLASCRIPPNPKIIATPNNSFDNTYTAVISQTQSILSKKKFENSWEKDYRFSSYLPDVCSSIFKPGWDITFINNDNQVFLSTMGLGTPFIEDMKFCAAMNGMWAASSPDTARVFQGTANNNEKSYRRNPTAIPLMDDELGFHSGSPADTNKKPSYGWDWEQGPFLENIDKNWRVNFTDLGRADYIQNVKEKSFNLSKLRDLTSKELFSRMDCLKKCINSIDEKKLVGYTELWLVSAEKLKRDSLKFDGDGMPHNLIGQSKDWATKVRTELKLQTKENCYLFIFADTIKDKKQSKRKWAETGNNVKRRWQPCNKLYVCQVSDSNIQWVKIIENGRVVSDINWKP